ncbi:oligosaccharide flippase family protein [Vibrio sp. B511a]|uniref:lipopolysaccharide biosynthesis protein n=1 Tax=Vibrio sp. B511a TaxID=2835905 RepID=UPI0025522EA1|nr:oligosaccharide flippase family protein [Vibrio sp. B511a]EJS2608298.1 oligosaccharide flippase family protein [Vibrio alginolyticus]MDK9732835.1 oligosaccharide flippase family protein [Vibrio sp. B511a]
MSFKKNVLKLLLGSAGAQVLGFMLLPVLTRLISPETMGDYSLLMMFVILLAPFIIFRLDLAILAKKEEVNYNVNCAFSILVYMGCAFLLMIMVLSFFWKIDNSYYLVVIAALVFALSQILISKSLSNGLFNIAAKHRFARALLVITFQISACYFIPNVVSMVLAFIFAHVIAITIYNKSDLLSLELVPATKVIILLKLEKSFTLYQNLSNAFSMLSQYVMNFSFAYFGNQSNLGHYSMTTKVMQTPITLVGGSLRDSFYYRFKNHKSHKSTCRDLKIFVLLSSLLFPLAYIISSYFPLIFSSVLGSEWRAAGEFAEILWPWFLLMFINQPFIVAANVYGYQKKLVNFDFITFIIRVFVVSTSWIMLEDVDQVLQVFTVTGIILNFILIIWVYMRLRK